MRNVDNVIAPNGVTQPHHLAGGSASPKLPPKRRPAARAGRHADRTEVLTHALAPGVVLGALGVLAFSFSFPATKLAVEDLDPWLVAFGRAATAGVLSALLLTVT